MITTTLTLEVIDKKSMKIVEKAKYLLLLCKNGDTQTFTIKREFEEDEEEEDELPENLPPVTELKPTLKIQEYIT